MLHLRGCAAQQHHVHRSERLHKLDQEWCCSRAILPNAKERSFGPVERFRQRRALTSRAAENVTEAPTGDSDRSAPAPTESIHDNYLQQLPNIAVVSYRQHPSVARLAVESIAAAFEDDPSTMYFCRPDQRVQFYRAVLSCLLDWYPEEEQLVCTLPSPDAAAVVYVYPRLRPLGAWTKLLRGGLAPLGCVRLQRLVAGMDASDFFEGQREEFFKTHGQFLYVSVMAVRPGRQGRGLGSALLAFICDRADAAGLHCYIEATSVRNRALYERFGFELIQEWRANQEMPYTYVLCREPTPLDSQINLSDDGVAAMAASPRAAHADADAGKPGVAAERGTVASEAAAKASSASAPWWGRSGQWRRQLFAERRRQQQQERQRHAADCIGTDGLYRPGRVPYIDLDEYGWWPLSANEPGTAAAAGDTETPSE